MGLVRKRAGAGSGKKDGNLTEGPIGRGLFRFMIPIFLGQLLQQLYNMADAWVVGNFASNDAFAAVSLSSNVNMSVITFFAGIAVGGGVVISKYFGAQDEEKLRCAVHTNFLLGIVFSVFATLIGLFFVPVLLGWLNTPDSVMVEARLYFGIYFAGVSTVIMYNICMNIMRAVGDSVHPLYYLIFSSVVNMILDLIFVAGFQWSAAGAAVATVIAQGLSVLLCMIRMVKDGGAATIHFKELRFNGSMIRQVITQGLPTGLQNSVISVGNLVVQSNINTFGAFAISGQGAFAKLEGIAFLPIMSMSMALTTFVSQNLGAGKADRAKKGSVMGVAFGMAMAELVGICLFIWVPILLRIFVDVPEAIEFGTIHGRTVALFFFLLAFSMKKSDSKDSDNSLPDLDLTDGKNDDSNKDGQSSASGSKSGSKSKGNNSSSNNSSNNSGNSGNASNSTSGNKADNDTTIPGISDGTDTIPDNSVDVDDDEESWTGYY